MRLSVRSYSGRSTGGIIEPMRPRNAVAEASSRAEAS
jgi:hypothetical protein